MAVLLVIPLIILAVAVVGSKTSDTSTSKLVADRLLDFSKSMEEDISRVVPIIAKRSISDAIVYIDTNGVALGNTDQALKELMLNGSLYGNFTSVDFAVSSWANILRQKGERFGFSTAGTGKHKHRTFRL